MSDEKTTPCKGCGRPMVWGETEEKEGGGAKAIPLDPRAPVYRILRHDLNGTPVIVRDKGAMVSHFATCPKASQFSASAKTGS